MGQALSASMHMNTEKFDVIFDTGATDTVAPYKSDFVSLDLKQYKHPLKGIAQCLEIAGEGVVEYAIVDEEGNSTTLRMKGLYKDI